ncbi:uncharacterized protein PF3D7_1120600-like [Cydia pomonella]|uniref:uncharacterized protein PF3D7_1120600-like n=1 Tax=Cydia pomonella TaxID=82600 RepID=UPI002ADDC37E|nr:uncharacterized protein PF3D7_1120600-like [Cydia pomonella]
MMEVVGAKLLLKLIISILYVSIVDSVPSKCQTPLNSSDCGLSSTVVYTYYSPSSICYPDLWRGCPTSNKFDNEDLCFKSCVMDYEVTEPIPKSEMDAIASKVQGLPVKTNTEIQSVKSNLCDVPLNTSRCTKQMKLVYTFSDEIKSCVPALWAGCPTGNMFPDISSCQHHCQEKKHNNLEQTDKTNVLEASNVLKKLIKTIDALNKENNVERKEKSRVQQASNVLQQVIKESNASNEENKLVQKEKSKMQVFSIDLKDLMKKTNAVAPNEENKIEQNYKTTVQEASNVLQQVNKKSNAPNEENELVQKEKSKMQEFSIGLKDLMKKSNAPNEENKIEQNDKSKVQEASNIRMKLIENCNAPNKENELEEKAKFKIQKVSNVYKKLIEKMEALKKGNSIDLDAKAYFIYKLIKANIKLEERSADRYIDLMLLDEYVI